MAKASILSALAVVFLTCHHVEANVMKEPVKSYENYQVLRVEIPTKSKAEELQAFENLQYWNEGRIGLYADVMVAPNVLQKVTKKLDENAFKFSVMVENVGDLIRLEKVILR